MSMEYDILFKIILIGDINTGKTTLVRRYIENKFDDHSIATIGIDFKIKTIKLKDKVIKLHIWDTSGQERFKAITTSYYRACHGIIITYDVTERDTYINVTNWLEDISRYVADEKNVIKILVGTKADSNIRCTTHEEIDTLCKTHNLIHMECSSKLDIGVNELFSRLTDELFIKKMSFLRKVKKLKINDIEVIDDSDSEKSDVKGISVKDVVTSVSGYC